MSSTGTDGVVFVNNQFTALNSTKWNLCKTVHLSEDFVAGSHVEENHLLQDDTSWKWHVSQLFDYYQEDDLHPPYSPVSESSSDGLNFPCFSMMIDYLCSMCKNGEVWPKIN